MCVAALKFTERTEKIILESICSTLGRSDFIQIVSDRKIVNLKLFRYIADFSVINLRGC